MNPFSAHYALCRSSRFVGQNDDQTLLLEVNQAAWLIRQAGYRGNVMPSSFMVAEGGAAFGAFDLVALHARFEGARFDGLRTARAGAAE